MKIFFSKSMFVVRILLGALRNVNATTQNSGFDLQTTRIYLTELQKTQPDTLTKLHTKLVELRKNDGVDKKKKHIFAQLHFQVRYAMAQNNQNDSTTDQQNSERNKKNNIYNLDQGLGNVNISGAVLTGNTIYNNINFSPAPKGEKEEKATYENTYNEYINNNQYSKSNERGGDNSQNEENIVVSDVEKINNQIQFSSNQQQVKSDGGKEKKNINNVYGGDKTKQYSAHLDFLALAKAYTNAGAYRDALNTYSRYLAQSKGSYAVYFNIASIYDMLCRAEDYNVDYSILRGDIRTDVNFKLEQEGQIINTCDMAGIYYDYSIILDNAINIRGTLRQKANLFYDTGRYEEALIAYQTYRAAGGGLLEQYESL